MQLQNQTLIVPAQLGERIKLLRTELGLSQLEVADDFITVRTLQKIEKGETTPTFEVLLHIANKLKIEMFDLVLSSRIPDYLNVQFPQVLADFFTSIQEATDENVQQKMMYYTSLLEELNNIKLPYEEHQRIEIVYAILQAFTHKHKDAAEMLLSDLIGHLIQQLRDSRDLTPTDHHTFLIAAYARLASDSQQFKEILDLLQAHPSFYYHPTIAYNIGLAYYKQQQWIALKTLSEATIKNIPNETNHTLLPLIYCQLGIAKYMLQEEHAAFIFDKGLELLILFRQEEHFNLMVAQAKNNNIPISVTQYIDYLV